VVKRISLTQPAPIQVDSTEPEVIEAALEQIPGRAIVNSINLEAGRDKADVVVPLAKAHGAALIALTIDEVGMAKTAERKVEIAKRIARSPATSTASTRGPDLRRAHCHAHPPATTSGSRRPSRRSRASADIKAEIPGVRRRWASPTFVRRRPARARAVLTQFSCTTASRPVSTWRWSIRTTSRRTERSTSPSASSPTTLVYNRREDALRAFHRHFESKGPRGGR
jgi:5-methyltetrahydrofolate--homocysteine methyltransferase